MSSAQGPREAGMQASANTAGRRRHGVLVLFGLTEASGMSRAKRGDATVANVASRRRCDVLVMFGPSEAAGVNRTQKYLS